MNVLIKQATVLCSTSQHHGKKRDILIKNGIIQKIAASITDNSTILEANGAYLSVGWLDLFADFCDPGFEHKEDIEQGLNLAAKSGFTDVCLLPSTNPATTSKSQVVYMKNKAQDHLVNIHPIGQISADDQESKLAEMYDMHANGALLFGNGKKSVQSAGLLLKALQYLKTFNGTIIQWPDTQSISQHGLMHEGEMSTELGLPGNPDVSEHLQIQRDLALCEYAGSSLHITGISTKKSVELIVEAKKKGISVSCSVSPAHLSFADTQLKDYDSVFKINPPLRPENDRLYLIKALSEGKIDAVASHHIPQDQDAKEVEFAYAKAGMISMQTCLSSLVSAGLSAEKIAQVLGENPRKIIGLEKEINEGAEACLTLFDTKKTWEYNAQNNLSKSANSPYLGKKLQGLVLAVINKNKLIK